MSESLGLTEAVSIALGGMIGGGIYAVLGVVAGITMGATWAAFVLAGVVVLGAGYAFTTLNRLASGRGGTVTFVQCFVGNTTLAGMTGWTLLVGYIGSMAMYAFAFAEFAVTLGLPVSLLVLPVRPLVSVLAVAGFVALNLLGARATGTAENFLVAAKVVILVAFGVLGVWYAQGAGATTLAVGLERLTGFGPVMAAAISFVAFQGWQLLFYDQDSIEDPVETIRTAVYVAIPVAVLIYVLVGVVTVSLVPDAIATHPHVALTHAAAAMASPFGLAAAGAGLLSASALLSTGSAINATLFSAAHFAKDLLDDDLLPDRVGDGDADGVPERTLVLIGAVTAAFAAVGSLGAITSFASLAFIVVFGGVSYLALRERHRDDVHALPPAVGLGGAAGFLPLLLVHLYRRKPHTLAMVAGLAVVIVTVELAYFERDRLEREVELVEDAAGAVIPSIN